MRIVLENNKIMVLVNGIKKEIDADMIKYLLEFYENNKDIETQRINKFVGKNKLLKALNESIRYKDIARDLAGVKIDYIIDNKRQEYDKEIMDLREENEND